MASIITRSSGLREIRFWIRKGLRKSFYVRSKTSKQAESIGKRLDDLAFCAQHRQTPDPDLSSWLLSIDESDYAKLASWGLVSHRGGHVPVVEPLTLSQWIDDYTRKAHTRKDSTGEQLAIAFANLTTFFGDAKPLAAINTGDAEDYRNWLATEAKLVGDKSTGLAHNTVRRRMGRAKQLFAAAVRHKHIPENPFIDEKSAVGANPERQVFVPADWIERCIRVAPCEDWRIIIAFARYAGMRSHETRLQRWDDIDIPNRRMIVRSNKTPPTRVCPIFPELMPHLLRAREMAPDGAEFVQTRYTPESNLGTTFSKIITKAGLVPWDKLMQNLRATRETELLASYPVKDVSSWLGNSAPVAMKHYAMAMQDSFERAIRDGARPTAGVVHQPIHHSAAEQGNQEQAASDDDASEIEENTVFCGPETASDDLYSYPARTRT